MSRRTSYLGFVVLFLLILSSSTVSSCLIEEEITSSNIAVLNQDMELIGQSPQDLSAYPVGIAASMMVNNSLYFIANQNIKKTDINIVNSSFAKLDVSDIGNTYGLEAFGQYDIGSSVLLTSSGLVYDSRSNFGYTKNYNAEPSDLIFDIDHFDVTSRVHHKIKLTVNDTIGNFSGSIDLHKAATWGSKIYQPISTETGDEEVSHMLLVIDLSSRDVSLHEFDFSYRNYLWKLKISPNGRYFLASHWSDRVAENTVFDLATNTSKEITLGQPGDNPIDFTLRTLSNEGEVIYTKGGSNFYRHNSTHQTFLFNHGEIHDSMYIIDDYLINLKFHFTSDAEGCEGFSYLPIIGFYFGILFVLAVVIMTLKHFLTKDRK